ncbi:MAG: hypothetical protein ABID87_03710 [Chloroflexota bacterium]
MKNQADSVHFEVLRPTGDVTAESTHPAPRPDTLAGKTVCEAWNRLFWGEKTFGKIRAELKKRYPGIKIVPYSEMPSLEVVGVDASLHALPGAMKKHGCDALIAGNGG